MFNRIKKTIKNIFRKNKGGLNFRRKRRTFNKERFKRVSLFLVEVALVIGLAYLVVICFGKQVKCSNVSMEPTYTSGDVLLINTVAYKFKEPERGDVIAFKPKSNVNASYSIKRIIGLPGDTVLIQKGRLYINGELYKESGDTDYMDVAGIAATDVIVGENEYFVLGDNRNLSEDSRFETIGNVSKEHILGKVWLKYFFK